MNHEAAQPNNESTPLPEAPQGGEAGPALREAAQAFVDHDDRFKAVLPTRGMYQKLRAALASKALGEVGEPATNPSADDLKIVDEIFADFNRFFGQDHLYRRIEDANIGAWARIRAALLSAIPPAPAPAPAEAQWMFSFKADGETPWQVCAGTYADMKALFDQRRESWTDVYLSRVEHAEETHGAPPAPQIAPQRVTDLENALSMALNAWRDRHGKGREEEVDLYSEISDEGKAYHWCYEVMKGRPPAPSTREPERAAAPSKAQCQNCESSTTAAPGFGFVCESCWREANEGYGRGILAEENGHVPRGFGPLGFGNKRCCNECGNVLPSKGKCRGKTKLRAPEGVAPKVPSPGREWWILESEKGVTAHYTLEDAESIKARYPAGTIETIHVHEIDDRIGSV